MSKTASKPAALPPLTDHPPYAAALETADRIAARAAPVAAELREVDAAIAAARSDREEQLQQLRRQWADRVRADAEAGRPTAFPPSPTLANLLARRAELEAQLDAVRDAHRQYQQDAVEPARRAAAAVHGPALRRDRLVPAVRQAGAALATAFKAVKQARQTRQEMQEAGYEGYVGFDLLPSYLDLSDPHQLAHLIRELAADGFLTPAEAAAVAAA